WAADHARRRRCRPSARSARTRPRRRAPGIAGERRRRPAQFHRRQARRVATRRIGATGRDRRRTPRSAAPAEPGQRRAALAPPARGGLGAAPYRPRRIHRRVRFAWTAGRPPPGALSRSGMSGHGNDRQDAPGIAQACGDLDWAFRASENAVILLDGDRRPLLANASAVALAARALPGEGPDELLALLPADAWEHARDSGRWAGEVTAASGMVL